MRGIERGWLTAAWLQACVARATQRVTPVWFGQSTVEYALVGALVVIAAAGALTLLGGELNTVFRNISSTLGAAAGSH